MPILLIIILGVLALPFLILLGFFHLIRIGFANLGIAPELVLILLVLMLLGSLVNIPLGRRRITEVEEAQLFGLVRRRRLVAQGLSVNVGGAVIPILISLYLLTRVPLNVVLVPVAVMVVVAYFLAQPAPGKGIKVPALLIALITALVAFITVPDHAPLAAFIAGSMGVVIGADLLHLPRVLREGQGIMSIGGAGVFDGIFLIGIISALLAGL